jgi:hypothetical protein
LEARDVTNEQYTLLVSWVSLAISAITLFWTIFWSVWVEKRTGAPRLKVVVRLGYPMGPNGVGPTLIMTVITNVGRVPAAIENVRISLTDDERGILPIAWMHEQLSKRLDIGEAWALPGVPANDLRQAARELLPNEIRHKLRVVVSEADGRIFATVFELTATD